MDIDRRRTTTSALQYRSIKPDGVEDDMSTRPIRGRRGRGGAAWAMVPMLSAILLTTVAPPAAAESYGCTTVGNYRFKGASPNDLCIFVDGDGLNVESARVRVRAPAGGVNNIVLRITFFDTNRRQGEQHLSRLYSGSRTWENFTIRPNRDYPAGRVCGSFTENGVERPGACVSLHR